MHLTTVQCDYMLCVLVIGTQGILIKVLWKAFTGEGRFELAIDKG